MLAGIRKYTRGFVALTFIGLLAVAFVIYEIRDIFSPQAGNDVARGEDVRVSPQEFRLEFEGRLREIQEQQKNPAITQRDLVEANVDAEVIQDLVARHAATALSRRMGFTASDAMVLEALQGSFRDPVTGQFNPDTYRMALARQGITPPFFEGTLRQELTRRQMFRAVTAGVRAPSSYGRLEYLLASERRTVSAARVMAARLPPIPDPTEQQLTEWYANPPTEFIRPEQRSVTLFIADPKTFAAKVALKDEDVTRQVDFEISRAGTPEKRSFAQVSFPRGERAKADQAATRLRAGASGETAAQESGGQALSRMELDRASVGDEALAAALFGLGKIGDVATVETALGVSAIRLTAITAGVTPSRDSLIQKVRADLTQRETENLVQKAVDAFDEAKVNGEDTTTAAAAAGLQVVKLDGVDARGFDDAGKPVAALQGFAEKLKDIFATPEGESTAFAPSTDRRWAMAQIDDVRASAVRPLGEVRAAAIAAFKAQKQEEAMATIAAAIQADVAKGVSFRDALRSRNLTPDLSGTEFNRESIGSTALAPFAGAIFSAAKGEVVTQPSPQMTVIIHIDSIARGDPNTAPGVIEQRRANATGALREGLASATTAAALAQAKTRINQQRVNALIGRVDPAQQGGRP